MTEDLYNFMVWGDYNQRMSELAAMTIPEPWSFAGRNDNIILKNYMAHTFDRLNSVPFEEVKERLLQNEECRKEYERLRPRYEIIGQIIFARNEQHMSQSDLAKKVGTQKSNISRFESGNYNPSLDFLTKVSEALGKTLNIQLI